jgi:Helix-turn-helix domain
VSEFSKLTWRKDAVPHTRGLTATQMRVLDVVFNHTNAEGKNAHPKQTTIAEMVGVSERQVRRVLEILQDRGLIECVGRGSARRREASVYELRLPDIGSPDTLSITGHGTELLPDIEPGITGHPEPDYRTSGELLPDMLHVRPSDPDPSDPESDPFLEASIFDDRPEGPDGPQGESGPDLCGSDPSSTSSPEAALPLASLSSDSSARWDLDLATATHETRNPDSDASASSDPQVPPTEGPTPMNDPFELPTLTDAEKEIVAEFRGEVTPSSPVGHREPVDPFISSEFVEHFRAKYAAEDAAAAARATPDNWTGPGEDPWV